MLISEIYWWWFLVIMVRQIAQLIGGETKYGNVFSSIFVIGAEEGPAGFFSLVFMVLTARF